MHQKAFILHAFCFSGFQELYNRKNSKILQNRKLKGLMSCPKQDGVSPIKGGKALRFSLLFSLLFFLFFCFFFFFFLLCCYFFHRGNNFYNREFFRSQCSCRIKNDSFVFFTLFFSNFLIALPTNPCPISLLCPLASQ